MDRGACERPAWTRLVTDAAPTRRTRADRQESGAGRGPPPPHPGERARLTAVLGAAGPASVSDPRDHAARIALAASGRRLDMFANEVVVHGAELRATPFIGNSTVFGSIGAAWADARRWR